MGFGVWGLGLGAWGLGFGVWGLGFGVWVLGFGFTVYLGPKKGSYCSSLWPKYIPHRYMDPKGSEPKGGGTWGLVRLFFFFGGGGGQGGGRGSGFGLNLKV